MVRRPWGIDGSIAATRYSDDPDRFASGSTVYINGIPYEILESKLSQRAVVLRLSGVDSPEDAEPLRESPIEMDEAEIGPPPEGSYYHYQIIGAKVRTVLGDDLGTITEILETGSNDVYVVRTGRVVEGKRAEEILVPALKDVIVDVDVERGVVTVDLPEGLR
ncbi:MAG: 16S rRNA processing protein RimM [Chloroflexi bacterium]|nr:16S rRNA processing protein RimM [Chloroflexota bacterium]